MEKTDFREAIKVIKDEIRDSEEKLKEGERYVTLQTDETIDNKKVIPQCKAVLKLIKEVNGKGCFMNNSTKQLLKGMAREIATLKKRKEAT